MNEFGWRLRESAQVGNLEKLLRELESGTPVDCTSYASGKTSLHEAAYAGHVDVVRLLIERGADVEAKDATGETPLHCAVAQGREACVAELLRSGADAWAHKNSNGKSAYAHAQELAKDSSSGKGEGVLRAFSEVYDMGGSDTQDPSKPPRWKPDDSVSACPMCKESFTLVRRKHHCRACGGIFCAKCSSGAAPLNLEDGKDVNNLSMSLKNVRVCDACFAELVAKDLPGSVKAKPPRNQRTHERHRSRSRSKNKSVSETLKE